ncbi:hypothetical protein H6G94_33315 [Nostoc punctiforme FACHB-252]|uniref:Uncharacterized protein n=1 Tax=Nostoc punctiforme FACHB-252 TaxID=1357509 RepID=A0ABR8HKG2_NOSPU|nr:hypothetical protein [Nostoc punctiforme FACHB-252]
MSIILRFENFVTSFYPYPVTLTAVFLPKMSENTFDTRVCCCGMSCEAQLVLGWGDRSLSVR